MTSWTPTATSATAPAPSANAFRRNIFGGTVGGPIKKNKAFFFMDYEGTEQRTPVRATASVAPQAWRTGDLSQFLTQNQVGERSADRARRSPATSSRLPASPTRSPLKLFSSPDFYPLPNNPGTGSLGITNNYIASQASKISNHQADAKVDYRLTDNDAISGRWSIGRYTFLGSGAALPVLMTTGQNGPTTSAVATWTRTYSPRLVNESRISFSRTGVADQTLDWSGKLGADGNSKFGIAGGQPIPGLSGITLGGGLTGIGAGASIADSKQNNYQAQTHFTFQASAHLLKFGGQLFRAQQNHYYAGNNGALGLSPIRAATPVSTTATSCSTSSPPKAAAPSPGSGDIATGATPSTSRTTGRRAATLPSISACAGSTSRPCTRWPTAR